jgi:phosphate starvation-inducible PhoH-like protein
MTQITVAEEGLDVLFGTHDENLRRVEKTFGVTVSARGNEIQVRGEEENVAVVERLFAELSSISEKGYRFRPGEVTTAIRVFSSCPRGCSPRCAAW